MKHNFLISLLFFALQIASPQDTARYLPDTLPDRFYLLENINRGGETLPEISLDEVNVIRKMSLRDRFQWWRHRRLVYNVKQVYPYCIVVREALAGVNDELELIEGDRERRQFLKDYEKQIFKEYEGDMREMTITQGKILIKLIDRETQNSSFDLIKEYRGPVSAVFWQGIARFFGTNLKERYDPIEEDYLIERVILEIEAGRI